MVKCVAFFAIFTKLYPEKEYKQAGAELSQARLNSDQIMLCQTQLG